MKKTLLALAAMASIGAATNAQAFAYARSFNEVTNLVISSTPDVVGLPPSTVNSAATACLPNGTCVSAGGAGVVDASPAQLGLPGYVNNSYGVHFANPTSFALGDASIDNQQTLGDPFTRARNQAEGLLLQNNTANATAGNSSATLLSSTFVVGTPGGTVRFQFDAIPEIRSELSAGALPLSQAEGILALNFNIVSSTGALVFNWAPDGLIGGITGGAEGADPFTLNTTITALPGNPGPLTFNPSCAVIGSPTGCFNATTAPLAAGIYTLNLAMRETVNLQLAQEVPEPGTIFLLGIGLAALGASTRHRRAAGKA